jgi:hypothetical protein
MNMILLVAVLIYFGFAYFDMIFFILFIYCVFLLLLKYMYSCTLPDVMMYDSTTCMYSTLDYSTLRS